LIIELVDNWRYYLEGKHTFTDWRHIPDEKQFYYNPMVVKDFKQYINHLLNHVNVYTHIPYKDDPTIMAWETGDELSPPMSWTRTIATYLRRLDHHHLIVDGSREINRDALGLTVPLH